VEDPREKGGAGPVGGIAPIPPYPTDPVQENPFPEDSPGHKIWQAATIAAERDQLHFRSYLIALPPPNNYEEIEERFIKSTVVQFEIWAKRDIAVVCDHETARYCAKRFHETVESKLKSFLENPPPQVRLESFLPKLRQRLLSVAEYWSALALNRAIPPKPDESGGRDATAAGAARRGRKPRCPVNGEKLKWYRKRCKMSQGDLAEKLEVDLSTIQRGESGRAWEEDTFIAAAQVFAGLLNERVTPEDLKIPQKLQK
jgi:DNA-binding XRE family transcriptional regulator